MQLRQQIRQIEFNYDFAVFSQTAIAYQIKDKEEIVFISYSQDDQAYMVSEIGDNYFSSVPYEMGSIEQCIEYVETRYKDLIINTEDYRVKRSDKKRSSLDPLI